ncbi:hypothetical protein HYPBUDRAFT_207495 [Hyphopichia burtonii NRRL Y-1933]|uniref:Uncharacterized protein n=1 Tax=Hyphopichia burtonii NRRL Y-1933 TaxID=984485 RepID=A0A1E4RIG7_9ASCO|nr:hypothetical protein HYPBUDRAFT_207495 [Hyphopichia burtonii NRRL Y-1933]ODV67064.1 hypothetical protein HYPBUDRAFT_207495 [Hyphopichia burtonii NRRL Y-1933]
MSFYHASPLHSSLFILTARCRTTVAWPQWGMRYCSAENSQCSSVLVHGFLLLFPFGRFTRRSGEVLPGYCRFGPLP